MHNLQTPVRFRNPQQYEKAPAIAGAFSYCCGLERALLHVRPESNDRSDVVRRTRWGRQHLL
ncbi:hypothetical protein K2P47_04530 [Patescibacteria group bacterium]|nr:hypothetical protein [Patescibacteria group bacterium]